MIDCVNGGPQSKIMERELRECGVDTSYFSVDASLPDPRCLIMLKDGERVIFVMDRKKRDLKLTGDQGRLIAEADIVYSSLSELRAFGDEEHITERIVASGAKLALDVEAGTLACLLYTSAAEAVPASFGLLAAAKGDTMEAIYAGVNIGNDTDTIATMVGGILGALNGIGSLPKEYVEVLETKNNMDLRGMAGRIRGMVG